LANVQRFKMTLTMLGPVHVGSGQMLGPMDYIVREDKSGVIWFYAIDAGRMFSTMSERQRADLDGGTRGGGLSAGLRRFVAGNFDPARHVLWQCQADEQLVRACRPQPQGGRIGPGGRREGGDREREREVTPPAVLAMTRTGPRNDPYLPGSSIKGAIRTAWLWYRSGAGKARPGLAGQVGRIRADVFEAEVLGNRVQLGSGPDSIDTVDPHADPLRCLRVRDAQLVADSNVIERVILYESDGKATREPMFVDATFSGLEDEQITAAGQMTVYDRLQEHAVPEGLRSDAGRRWRWPKAVADPIDAEQVLQACREFYGENLAREHDRFYKSNRYLRPIGEKLMGLAGQLGPHEALLRVGRFSHFENMTVRPYAEGGSKTRGLAGALRPMGWVKMRLDLLR
jgi:hypothetical protein